MDWVLGVELTLGWLGIVLLITVSAMRSKGTNGMAVLTGFVVTTVVGVALLFQVVSYSPDNRSEESGVIALAVGFGALALATFGAGFIAFCRQTRRASAPPPPQRKHNFDN